MISKKDEFSAAGWMWNWTATQQTSHWTVGRSRLVGRQSGKPVWRQLTATRLVPGDRRDRRLFDDQQWTQRYCVASLCKTLYVRTAIRTGSDTRSQWRVMWSDRRRWRWYVITSDRQPHSAPSWTVSRPSKPKDRPARGCWNPHVLALD